MLLWIASETVVSQENDQTVISQENDQTSYLQHAILTA